MKQLVCANLECDKKNKIFNIEGMTQSQVDEIKNRFPKKEWIVFERET